MVMSEHELHELVAALNRRLNGRSSDQLVTTYVEPNPYVPGPAEARLAQFGVPVWAVVGHYLAVRAPLEQVADDYELPLAAVLAAFAYYIQHREAIDARLEANAA